MVHHENKNVINITDLDQKIYRVFPLLRAIDLFATNKNGLVRPHLWDDPFENFFLNARLFNGNDEIDLSNIRRAWYGQCWTTLPESDAMWRIYSPQKDSVRVSTTIGKLVNNFFDRTDPHSSLSRFIGRVEYVPVDQIVSASKSLNFTDLSLGGGNVGFAKTLLLKREEFRHESEVRILFCDTKDQHTKNNFVSFDFDTSSLVEDVMFDPRLDMRIVSAYSYLISSLGYKGNISRSNLYVAPKLIISLS